MAYDLFHVVDSFKTCSPLVVSSVNALDIRNISLSYHADFFVCHVCPIISRGFRHDVEFRSIAATNPFVRVWSESFIFGNFETDDWLT